MGYLYSMTIKEAKAIGRELWRRGEKTLARKLVEVVSGRRISAGLDYRTGPGLRGDIQVFLDDLKRVDKMTRSLKLLDKHLDFQDFEEADKIVADVGPKLVATISRMLTTVKDINLTNG